jgi:multimeric flavodoxin WrbA
MKNKKILSICGSPRKGNSEAILGKLNEIFNKNGTDNEIILLRNENIQRCNGCVEYCNHNLKCCHKDGMAEIMRKMVEAEGYVFALPNYFGMPPGLFKDFIDKCSVLYTSHYFSGKPDLSSKKAAVISVGTDLALAKENVRNIADNFCKTLEMKVVATDVFISKSELMGNYNDIFENNLNLNIEKRLDSIIAKLI